MNRRVRVQLEVEEVKGKTESEAVEKTEKKSEKRDEKVKEERKEVHRCDQCKWYDVSTQRDFHRDGIRKGLVEVRAVCRSPTARAKGHLVKNDSDRPCFEKGVYVKPQKPKKKEKPSLTKVSDVLHEGIKDRKKRATRIARRFVNFATRFNVSIKRAKVQKIVYQQLEIKKPNLDDRISMALCEYLEKEHNIVGELKTVQKLVQKGLKLKTVVVESANGETKTLQRKNGRTFVVNK